MLKRMFGCFAVVLLAVAMHQPVAAQNNADFDGDGTVGFADFLEFAGQFGAQQGDGRYQAKYDLNSDGKIDFADFLLFASSYGNTVPPSNGGSGGGSGGSGGSRPDLIVESPSVSDNTLTPGQSFTLQVTVRNRGTWQSTSTTLRYYRSVDATISTSDREIGTDSILGLSASGTVSKSISLTAPSRSGTYYYGACVNAAVGESNTDNNCSTGVATVKSGDDPALYWTENSNRTYAKKNGIAPHPHIGGLYGETNAPG